MKLDGSKKGMTLSTFLKDLQRKSNARFYFIDEWVEPITLQQSFDGKTLRETLDELFEGSDLDYIEMYSQALVILKNPNQALFRKNAIEAASKQQKKIEQHIFGEAKNSISGKAVIISGKVIDAKTKEPMPRANIQLSDTQNGTTTDESGNYQLSLAPGAHVLSFSFVDYEDKIIDLVIYQNSKLNLEMEENAILLNEVIVQDRTTHEMTSSRIGLTEITMRDIKRAPAMLGEADIIKQVQTLPGVTTVGEAASGFNVRGGSVDQNLILYDGLPVFSSSHVFGFFSAFNPEAVRNVSFYRGGIPAEYGGRISSVLDIRSKDGSTEKWNGNAGIGLIASNLMVNGPIKKDKTSLAISLRSSYSNWLVHSIRTNYADLSKSSVLFYDGTIKATHLFNSKTKLSITGYSSHDSFRLVGDSTYQWNTMLGAVRLDHQFSPKLSSEFIVGQSSYNYKAINSSSLTASILAYRINTTTLKAGFNYQQGKHKINFGWQLTYYWFNPGQLKPDSPESTAKDISLNKQSSIENAYYVTDEFALSDKLVIETGLRLPTFISFGKANVNAYKEGLPRDITHVTNTLHYRWGEPIKIYFAIEPRLSLRWLLNSKSSLKVGYNRINQFLHLVTNTTAVTPIDIWQPSGYYFKPQIADQISIGYFKDFSEKKYGVSAETFYKNIQNLIDFKDGAQLILNNHIETDLLQGKGFSYGIETSFNKNIGRLTGTLNYTYSRSFRLISNTTSGESINSGNKYPSNFDQPYILNLSWKYDLTRRCFFTGNFTYHTGRPVTIPISAFSFENTTVAYFSGRNQYRIPDYHRLDLALIVEGSNKRKKKMEGSWVFSVYNVYGRTNPYTVFFKSSGNGIPKPYQLSIIGTVLPSISYNVKF